MSDPLDVAHLIAGAAALSLKERLRLLAAVQDGLTVEREGLRLVVGSVGEYKRARKRQHADVEMDRWVATFAAGDVFYDVGANIGSVSLQAARTHRGRVPVYAIEPAADTFAALVRNIFANDLARTVTPLHVALFDETGVRPLHRSMLGAGSALHAVGEAIDYARQPFTAAAVEPVLAFRLDDLLQICALPAPTRLKIDVDGVEDKVLAGAERLLSGSRCEVCVEVVDTEAGDPHASRITAFMNRFGYEVGQVVEHTPSGVFPRIRDVWFSRR